MLKVLDPFRFLLIAAAGWMNQHQLQAIEYLREENRVLREQIGERRLRGRAESLSEDGMLLVRSEHGHLEPITGGDVILEKINRQ